MTRYKHYTDAELREEYNKIAIQSDSNCYAAPMELWNELWYRATKKGRCYSPPRKRPNIVVKWIHDNWMLLTMLGIVIVMYLLGYASGMNHCNGV